VYPKGAVQRFNRLASFDDDKKLPGEDHCHDLVDGDACSFITSANIHGLLENGRPIAPCSAMDPLLISAASGMKARMESLDMLANNIANSETAGFKSDREFYTLYQQELPEIERHWTDYSQGTLAATGNPLDLGLSGKGFFSLNSPSGVVYTRNGGFHISKAGELESTEGYTLRNLLDPMRRPIKVDPAQPLEIDKDGTVRQGGQAVGQLEIVSIDTAAKPLEKLGNSYFALMDKNYKVAPASGTEVLQGRLEQSNVPVSESAVRLVSVMRQFEMLQKAIIEGADMNKRAIDEVAKVSG
jgi:flagellar basal-body rod protein FlgF